MKLILATGIPELETFIIEHIGGLFKETQSVLFLQALTVVDVNHETTALISDAIQHSGDEHIVSVVDYLRRNNVRVIFVGMERPATNPMVQALLHRGVYDLLLSDELSVNDVLYVLQEPLTYRNVAHLFTRQNGLSRVPNTSRRLTIKHESDDKQQDQASTSVPMQMRLLRKNKQTEEHKVVPKAVIVSGLPGVGVSFVALHLALAHSETHRVALIEASERPVYTRWLNGPANDDGANQLASKHTIERVWNFKNNLRIYPARANGPRLKVLFSQVSTIENIDLVIIDARIEDVRAINPKTDILVLPPDPTKIELTHDIDTKALVINLTPKDLPAEIREYTRNWPHAQVVNIPFIKDQALSVLIGQPPKIKMGFSLIIEPAFN